MPTLIVQKWETSGSGQKPSPDGYSLHLIEGDRYQFITEYWCSMPGEIPQRCSRPAGHAYLATVDQETYSRVGLSANGIRCSGTPPGQR